MKLHHLFTYAALSVILAGLVSCSKDAGEILDTIPASSPVVALIDANTLCAESGISFTPEGAAYDKALEGKIPSRADGVFGMAARLHARGIAGLDNVAIFSTPAGDAIATFPINEFASFREACADGITWTDDAEGMHVGAIEPHISVVASENQVWLTDHSTAAAKTVRQTLDAARKLPIGSLEGVSAALRAKGLVKIAALSGKLDDTSDRAAAQQAVWNTAVITAPDSRLDLSWTRIKGDGATLPLDGLQQLNPAVLSYINGTPMVAAAVGITSGFDWSLLSKLAMLSGDFQTQAMLSMAMPYLNSIDGTVMIAASPADSEAITSEAAPTDWRFILMAHMPQDKINEILGTARTMCFTAGITPDIDPKTGIMHVRYYGMRLWLGNVDGYFAISSAPISADGNNELAPAFVNKQGAAAVSIPSLKPYGPGLPAWGIKAAASVDGATGSMQLSLPGSQGSVLLNILATLL